MKRIRVPEERLERIYRHLEIRSDVCFHREIVAAVCEAFAKDLSEHPQVPTDEQLDSLRRCFSRLDNRDRDLIINWQRRCFVQEEPEIPAEIEDLLKSWEGGSKQNLMQRDLIEAYRRGLRKGEKK